jgi:hypothetical protein
MLTLVAVVSRPSLLLILIVFGFAPGLCLRVIVLAYPRSDLRRAELIPKLYAVPRLQRPLWVAEQLKVALFEAPAARLRSRRTRPREWHAWPREGHAWPVHFMLAIAVWLLPPSARDRHLEEFHAELLDLPPARRVWHALSLLRGAFVMRLRRGFKNDGPMPP